MQAKGWWQLLDGERVMSIRLMSAAWETRLQTTRKIVLLAMADNANDEGVCFPAINTIADKCSLTGRAVMIALKELEAAGYLLRHQRSGKATVYEIRPVAAWPKVQDGEKTASDSADEPDTHTPEHYSPLNIIHPCTTFTPELSSPITININKKIDSSEEFAEEPAAAPQTRALAAVKTHEVRGTRLAADWQLPHEWIADAISLQPSWTQEHALMISEGFADYWHSAAGARASKRDWRATWRNWCRNAKPLNNSTGAQRNGNAKNRGTLNRRADIAAALDADLDALGLFT